MRQPGKKDPFFEVFLTEIVSRIKNEIKQTDSQPEFLSARTIARILDCSVSEVRKKLQENKIPSVPFGRGYRVDRREFERRLNRWRAGGDLWD